MAQAIKCSGCPDKCQALPMTKEEYRNLVHQVKTSADAEVVRLGNRVLRGELCVIYCWRNRKTVLCEMK